MYADNMSQMFVWVMGHAH